MKNDTMHMGKRLNIARKDCGFTAERLSELCNINAVYLRQIEGGAKVPSLPVFIDLCNALQISPAYLLQDSVPVSNFDSVEALVRLWNSATPRQMKMITAMLQAALAVTEED